MNDNEQFTGQRFTHRDIAFFRQRMSRIGNGERQTIAENSRRLFKADAMFAEVRSRLALVPFKR